MSKTTYTTRWGCDDIAVTADWAQACSPVEGGESIDGMSETEAAPLILVALLKARAALKGGESIDGMSETEAAPLILVALLKARAALTAAKGQP
jgi:hypothetical protein